MAIAAGLLAGAIAGLITATELVTSKYPRTFPFILWPPSRSWAFYILCVVYGAIAFGIDLGLKALTDSGAVHLSGFGLDSPWVQALAVGLTIRALLHLNLFNTTVGTQSFPVGLETIVQLFEPWLLRTIVVDEFKGVRSFARPRADNYADLDAVKTGIKGAIPTSLPEQERRAFEVDVDDASNTTEAFEKYLRFVGRGALDGTFPPMAHD